MTQNTRVDETVVQHGADSGGFRSSPVVDWVVALFLTMTGLVFAFGGYLLYAVADRSWIAGRVADGTITSTELTDAELVDVTYALAWGSGIGLAATGIILVAAGVAFLVLRARARRRAEETGVVTGDTTTTAVIGAVVTVVASFVPFSPVLGGAVAGYLRNGDTDDGLWTGSMAGLFTTVPVIVLFAGIVVALVDGTALTAAVGLLVVAAMAVAVLYVVALSAIGGYVGGTVAVRKRERSA